MADLLTYAFEGHEVRVQVDESGAPWFAAADACAALGIGPEQVRRLDMDEKGLRPTQTPGGEQALGYVSEPGLFTLVLGCRKPEAKRFKRWVTHEVLPALRKTGRYAVPGAEDAPIFYIPKTLSEALRLAAAQAERLEEQSVQLAAQRPAVDFLERYVETRSTKSLREVAKVLGLKERAFVKRLEEDGVCFRQSGRLLPAAEYQHRGLFEVLTGESRGHAFLQLRFTPAGIVWAAKRYAGAQESLALADEVKNPDQE